MLNWWNNCVVEENKAAVDFIRNEFLFIGFCTDLVWVFLFKEQASSDIKESPDVKPPEEQSSHQQMMDRKRQEQGENCPMIGNIAKTMVGRNSTFKKKSTLYIIGDYIYVKIGLNCEDDGSQVLMLRCSSSQRQCMGRAHIDRETLKVLKCPWPHSCTRDPDLKYQLEMENEMESLAETTTDRARDIYNKVCLKNPNVATRIKFSKVCVMIHRKRKFKEWMKMTCFLANDICNKVCLKNPVERKIKNFRE